MLMWASKNLKNTNIFLFSSWCHIGSAWQTLQDFIPHTPPFCVLSLFFWSADFLEKCFTAPPRPTQPTIQICPLMCRGPPAFIPGCGRSIFGSRALYRNLLYQGVLPSWYVGIERTGHVQTWLRSWCWPEVKPSQWREGVGVWKHKRIGLGGWTEALKWVTSNTLNAGAVHKWWTEVQIQTQNKLSGPR